MPGPRRRQATRRHARAHGLSRPGLPRSDSAAEVQRPPEPYFGIRAPFTIDSTRVRGRSSARTRPTSSAGAPFAAPTGPSLCQSRSTGADTSATTRSRSSRPFAAQASASAAMTSRSRRRANCEADRARAPSRSRAAVASDGSRRVGRRRRPAESSSRDVSPRSLFVASARTVHRRGFRA